MQRETKYASIHTMAKVHAPDYKLIGVTALILLIGLVILSSASSALGYEKFQDTFYYLKRQVLFGLIPGVIALIVFSRINYHAWRKVSTWLLIGSIGLLLAVFIPGLGAEFGGSRSWIVIGGFSLQPSEIVKLTFLIYLAVWLERRARGIHDLFSGLIPFISIVGIIAVLVILQPDIGTLSIILVMAFIVYFAAGAPWKHLFALGAGGAAALFALIKLAPYRALRLMTFLNPELDTQGAGYHLKQSLLAIGSGGLFGLGLGQSRQKFAYLPEAAGDSIFAIAAEELGFFVSVAIVLLFAYFVYRGIKIAQFAPDVLGRLLGAGIIGWIGWQAFVNIGAMVGLLPLTGIPLPLISHGGTALATSLAGIGILINISKHTGQKVSRSAVKWRKRNN